MKKVILIFSIFLVFVLFLVQCKKDEDQTPDRAESIEEAIIAGGNYDDDFVKSEIMEVDDTPIDSTIQNEYWTCTRTHYNIVDGADEQALFDPGSNVIYPGNLLQGGTLDKSPPDVIVVERAGGSISYNLNNGNLVSSFTVDKVTKSAIQDAMNNIIANAGEVVPANFVFTYSKIQSREQLALELGVNVDTKFVDVEADLALSTDKAYNRILVKLSQQYYTMSFDLPTSYDKLFAPSVTATELAKYIGHGNPAVYISDVTYGRIFYMLIESTSSVTEMEAQIAGSFNNFVTKVDVELNVESVKQLSELKTKVIAFGGDAKGAMSLMGETDLSVIADRMAESTDIRAGLPLSYVIRNVYNNQIVSMKLATEYDIVNCTIDTTAIKDWEGNNYKTATFKTPSGDWEQTWMAENLKTKYYNDGDPIGTTSSINEDISEEGLPKYQWAYDGNEENANTYGRLYTGIVAVNPVQFICPAGWHVPSLDEWDELRDYLIKYEYNYDGTIEGNKIAKAMAMNGGWQSSTVIGSPGNVDYPDSQNSSRFSAVPSGFRDKNSFLSKSEVARWWTSDAQITYNGFPPVAEIEFISYIDVIYDNSSLIRGMKLLPYYGCAIRCIKDPAPSK